MTDIAKIRQATSIMTMSHETINQMNRYQAAVYKACENYQAGIISFEAAVSYVRKWG